MPFLDRIGRRSRRPSARRRRSRRRRSTRRSARSTAQQPQAVFVTGDITDNAQRNELDLALDTLDGKTRRPRQRRPGYDGVQDADSADPFYYRPDHDAPAHPGAIDAGAEAVQGAGPERARGTRWSATTTCSPRARSRPRRAIDAFATGDRLVPSLDPDLRAADARGRRQAGRRRGRSPAPVPLDTRPHARRPDPPPQRARRGRAPRSATRHGLHGRPRHRASERS